MSTVLKTGMRGAEIGNWQRFLSELGYLDSLGNTLAVDEDFGTKTEWATKNFQAFEEIDANGTVDETTRVKASAQGFVPFVQAKNCQVLWPACRGPINLIIIHTMEAPEKPHTAANVAAWFAGASAPMASAHFCVDVAETIQTVRETDVAWHAPGANRSGIGIEHAGYAAQTTLDWTDDYSKAVLERSAQLAAKLVRRWKIPIVKLSPVDLKSPGVGGFAGHVDVTIGLNGGKGHTDPGQNFPWESYLERVKELLPINNFRN